MTQEMQTAVSRLQSLPEAVQENVAPHLNAYLNRLDDLRAAIQEGIDSGNDGPLNMAEIIAAARAERDAEAS
ncbi:MAG: hypothetical protein AAGJ10_10575 [Bacteroidota bacterium]